MKLPSLRAYRRTIQIGVAIAFIIIPWLNHLRISIVYGNFLSFHLYTLPLADPLAVLQVTFKNFYFCADLLIGAAIALLLAACLGTVFCAWICPFGLLSEWGYALAGQCRTAKRMTATKPRRRAFRAKLFVFMLGLAGFFLCSTTPVLNQLSLPAWYSRIFQFWFEQRHLSLAIIAIPALLLVEMVAGRRLWCRYICPQSVLIILAKQLNRRRLQVSFEETACVCHTQTTAACQRACTLELNPKELNRWPETECTNCGDCIQACKRRGRALTFTMLPRRDEMHGQ